MMESRIENIFIEELIKRKIKPRASLLAAFRATRQRQKEVKYHAELS
jgi:hypothetical protein